MGEFSHFDQHGNAVMVDVTEKKETTRTAIAQGKIKVNDEIFAKVKEGSMAKGMSWEPQGSLGSWQQRKPLN